MPLPEFNQKIETYTDLIKKNSAHYDLIATTLNSFDYDADISYAKSEFENYVKKQNEFLRIGTLYWLNKPCISGDTIGRTKVYSYY